MMKDPYGNYVAQKLYGSVDDSGKKEFAVKLSQPEVVTELRKDNYGINAVFLIILIFFIRKTCFELFRDSGLFT